MGGFVFVFFGIFLSVNLNPVLEYIYSFETFFSPCSPNISGFRLNRDMYKQNLLGNEPSRGSSQGIAAQFLYSGIKWEIS